MLTRKIWLVEEVTLENEDVGHRQSLVEFNESEVDGSWFWVCPSDRLDEAGQAEWFRVLDLLKNVNGEDLRHIVCGVGLMDHCNNPVPDYPYFDPNTDQV